MTGTGSHMTGTGSDRKTGSHVIWKEKPLSSLKNGSWAQDRAKPRRKRGRKVQSPIFGMGVINNNTNKIMNTFYCQTFFSQQEEMTPSWG